MPDTPITPERLQEIEQRLAIAERLKDVPSDEPDWYLHDVKLLVAALRAEREENARLRERVEVYKPLLVKFRDMRAAIDAALRGGTP